MILEPLDDYGRCLCGQWHFRGSRAYQLHILEGRVARNAIPFYAARRRVEARETATQLQNYARAIAQEQT